MRLPRKNVCREEKGPRQGPGELEKCDFEKRRNHQDQKHSQ